MWFIFIFDMFQPPRESRLHGALAGSFSSLICFSHGQILFTYMLFLGSPKVLGDKVMGDDGRFKPNAN
jgi:uncharacterized BrkB/YihY/UPF0761 family membrane protein